ncbi:PEP-CTERM/exosortase system-associated acyltransferase [Nitrosococcus watsonii]|nr:PEP-CTERM/exosortase system-associated acyltransferase [Nitrosococcus watsonii]
MSNLITAFEKYFKIIPANVVDSKNRFHRLRYQVYSQELQLPDFEAWRYPDGREIDEYDNRSICSLLYHRESKNLAGGVRLVLCNSDDPLQPFPIEEHAGHYFDKNLVVPNQLPRRTTAEITRLMLARNFRCRGQEALYAHGMDDSNIKDSRSDSRRQFPHPILGLLVALVRMSSECGITHWYAGMEPVLNRRLRQFGANLKPIGPLVEYHGGRRPYLDTIDNVLGRMFRENRAFWELITNHGKLYPDSVKKLSERECRVQILKQGLF